MRKELIILSLVFLIAEPARADFWGGDLPLLFQIVTNTLQTLWQLESQTSLMRDEMEGISDRIYRISTISEIVQPSQWEQWKDPSGALSRLKMIYETLPKEYRSAKSDEIEREISEAMNMVSRVGPGSHSTFRSGKELESRGALASPGVAQKLTASGVGSLVAIDAQNQIIFSHITSLLAQTLADANEKEVRGVVSKGQGFSGVSDSLASQDGKFSTHALPSGMNQ